MGIGQLRNGLRLSTHEPTMLASVALFENRG
jgi:hypothetical protein